MSATPPVSEQDHNRKRKRLAFACSACRARKVRCDDRQPKCSNCLKANIDCETTDPRQNGRPAQRIPAQSLSTYSTNRSISPVHDPNVSTNSGPSSIQSRPSTSEHLPSRDHEVRIVSNGSNIHLMPTSVQEDLLPVLPRFIFGNSLQVLTQWLDLAFARIGVPHRFFNRSDVNQHGQKSIALRPTLGRTPARLLIGSNLEDYVTSYLQSINIIYPIFEENDVREMMDTYARYEDDMSSSSAITMLIMAISETTWPTSDPAARKRSIDHVNAAYSLLAIIIVESSLRSTQALFLLTLVLRGYNEIEMAWYMINVATSMAQSLGLHRCFDGRRRNQLGEKLSEESIRTWWAIYSLEKCLSLEMERHSSIRDSECNQSRPKLDQDPPVFETMIDLALVQSQINEKCIQARLNEENRGVNYSEIIREKLENSGELDQMLVAWSEGLPAMLRPSNHLFCNPKLLPCVSFIAIQYHQTLVLLHRNTVLVNAQNAQREIDHFCSSKPYIHRLKMGQAICDDAARSIVNVLDNVFNHQADSILNSINAPLIATYALSIHLLKHPTSGLAKADLELQARAIRIVQHQQRVLGDQDCIPGNLLDALHGQVSKAIKQSSSSKDEKRKQVLAQATNNSHTVGSEQEASFEAIGDQVTGDDQDLNSGIEANSVFDVGTDPFSTLSFYPMDWMQVHGHETMVGGLDFSNMEADWDAIALAFDLPQ